LGVDEFLAFELRLLAFLDVALHLLEVLLRLVAGGLVVRLLLRLLLHALEPLGLLAGLVLPLCGCFQSRKVLLRGLALLLCGLLDAVQVLGVLQSLQLLARNGQLAWLPYLVVKRHVGLVRHRSVLHSRVVALTLLLVQN